MPGSFLHENATIACEHFGQVMISSRNQNVKVSGMAVATVDDMFTVTGCPFTVPGPKSQPCVKVIWSAATNVFVNGRPVALSASPNTCQSAEQIPQGTAKVTFVQEPTLGT